MRHLVIGNSHLGALKLGWDKIAKKHRDTELVFTGARGEQVRGLYLDGKILTTDSRQAKQMMQKLSGTTEAIDVTTFDKCWIVGCQLSVSPFFQLYRNFRSELHPDHGKNCQILSAEAFELAASSALDGASGLPLARSLVDQDLAVGLIPQPMPSHAVFDIRPAWRGVAEPDLEVIASLFAASLATIAETIGAQLAPQPESTLETPITTKAELARGSSGLGDNTHPDDDVVHMNRDYGRTVIETHLIS